MINVWDAVAYAAYQVFQIQVPKHKSHCDSIDSQGLPEVKRPGADHSGMLLVFQ